MPNPNSCARRCNWVASVLVSAAALAVSIDQANSEDLTQGLFESGRWEASAGGGVLFSPLGSARRPKLNYAIYDVRFGYMLTSVNNDQWLRGNLQGLVEGFGGNVVAGEGSYVAGMTLWLRYNFVPENWRWTPYVQGGAGLTSAHVNRVIVGQDFNFNLNLGVGMRYFLSRDWAITAEYRYQHISNAGLSDHNIGINSHGPMVGLSWFF